MLGLLERGAEEAHGVASLASGRCARHGRRPQTTSRGRDRYADGRKALSAQRRHDALGSHHERGEARADGALLYDVRSSKTSPLGGMPRSESVISRLTTGSLACPIARCSASCSASRSRKLDDTSASSQSSSSISIASRSSTTPSGTQPATAAARRLRRGCVTSCARVDCVARLGGDEFVVLVAGSLRFVRSSRVAQENTLTPADTGRIRGTSAASPAASASHLPARKRQDAQTLMKNADMAMYRAKEEGKNNYQFYSAEMSRDSVERPALEIPSARALERKEFALHYQPKVDIRTGAGQGCEALLRWWNLELGTVSPAHFIPVAEDTGLIVPIGKWVMRDRMRAEHGLATPGASPHRDVGQPVAATVQRPDAAGRHRGGAARTGMAPELLELEITESMIMHNVDQAAAEDGRHQGVSAYGSRSTTSGRAIPRFHSSSVSRSIP